MKNTFFGRLCLFNAYPRAQSTVLCSYLAEKFQIIIIIIIIDSSYLAQISPLEQNIYLEMRRQIIRNGMKLLIVVTTEIGYKLGKIVCSLILLYVEKSVCKTFSFTQ